MDSGTGTCTEAVTGTGTRTRTGTGARLNDCYYALLARTREKATKDNGYCSKTTRQLMTSAIQQYCDGKTPYEWQLDVSEAIILGLDTILIAGTGSGKTLPFVMPLLADETRKKRVVIISTLNEPECDQASNVSIIEGSHQDSDVTTPLRQARRFNAMGLSATPVNSDTWNRNLHKVACLSAVRRVLRAVIKWMHRQDIKDSKYRVLLTSPEIMLEHPEFSKIMRSPEYMQDTLAIVVDESHVIPDWGAAFRPKFAELNEARSYIAHTVPILAASATLPPNLLANIQEQLEFSRDRLFLVNLGNDRHNITPIVYRMKGTAKDLSTLDFFVAEASVKQDLVRTIIYVNTRDLALETWQHLKSVIPANTITKSSLFTENDRNELSNVSCGCFVKAKSKYCVRRR